VTLLDPSSDSGADSALTVKILARDNLIAKGANEGVNQLFDPLTAMVEMVPDEYSHFVATRSSVATITWSESDIH
jgi:hypothetical protein